MTRRQGQLVSLLLFGLLVSFPVTTVVAFTTHPFALRVAPSVASTTARVSSTTHRRPVTVRHAFEQRNKAADTAADKMITTLGAGMTPTLLPFMQQERTLTPPNQNDSQTLLVGAGALLLAGGLATLHAQGVVATDAVHFVQTLLSNPQDALQGAMDHVQAMGPAGVLYFGILYLIAEILCVPATPLSLSAGYLFGVTQGATVCLVAATLAASISFFVGKTFLRSWVEGILEEKPEFRKLDQAIGKEGFKLLLLVRLSPIFPFALSNYLYGASSVDFASYFWGTLLGFTPGTFAYVYTGMVGQALTVGEGAQPWYVYGAGFVALLTFLKLVTDVATGIVNAIDEEGKLTE